MKILFFSSYPKFSGSHKMALQLAGIAKKAGHEVVLGAPEDNLYLEKGRAQGFDTFILQAPDSLLEVGGAMIRRSKIQKLRMLIFDMLPYQFRVWQILKDQGFDLVYIAQERGIVQIGLGVKMADIPLLWHLQGGLSDRAGLVHRIATKLADKIVCVSRAVQEDLLGFTGSRAASKTRILYNGLPDVDLPDVQSPLDKMRLLYAANITPHKGAHVLVEAISLLPDDVKDKVVFDLCGWVEREDYEAYLQDQIRRYGLEEIVKLRGFCEEIDVLTAASNIIICPTVEKGIIALGGRTENIWWKEGFNLSALEAMRAGKPVICSGTYGLKEVVEDGVTGLHVPPDDPAALAHAIEDLIKAPARAHTMGKAGRARYEALFTHHKLSENFIDILKD